MIKVSVKNMDDVVHATLLEKLEDVRMTDEYEDLTVNDLYEDENNYYYPIYAAGETLDNGQVCAEVVDRVKLISKLDLSKTILINDLDCTI